MGFGLIIDNVDVDTLVVNMNLIVKWRGPKCKKTNLEFSV